MKKRLVFLAMLVCVLAFGLVFMGCKDSGGGGLSVKSIVLSEIGFDPAAIYGSDPIPGSPTDEAGAQEVFEPIADVLQARYDLLKGYIEAYMHDYMDTLESSGKTSVNDTIQLSDILPSLTSAGIFNLTGNIRVTGSGSYTGGSYNITVTLSHEYDSEDDSSSPSYTGLRLYAKVKATSTDSYTGNASGETEVETLSLSYVTAYADTNYCGLGASNFSYKTTDKYPGTYTVNSAAGNITLNDLTGKQTFSYKMTKAEAIDFLDL